MLVVSTVITGNYAAGRRGIRIYEKMLKMLVWMIILAFAAVVAASSAVGRIKWSSVLKGFVPGNIPFGDAKGFEKFMGALGAAVGINMTFLFGYTLLARGWGREHRGLSRFDLITGMFIPYTLATSLVVIASGCLLHGNIATDADLTPVAASGMIENVGISPMFSRFVYGLGILGMALSTITLHMLVCGFAFCEIFRIEPGGWKYRLACLIPAPGILGVILWKPMGQWIAVPTSAICGLMIPIAYAAFFIMNNRRSYLGDQKPRGVKAAIWNLAMLVSIAVVTASASYYIYVKWIR